MCLVIIVGESVEPGWILLYPFGIFLDLVSIGGLEIKRMTELGSTPSENRILTYVALRQLIATRSLR